MSRKCEVVHRLPRFCSHAGASCRVCSALARGRARVRACALTFALELHHGLEPVVLVLLVLGGQGEALGARVQHDHVLVLGVGPLVDVEAGLQGHGFLRDGGLAAEFLLALVVLQTGRAALRGGAEDEVAPMHGLLLAEVAALPHVLAAVARLVLHDAPQPPLPRVPDKMRGRLDLLVFLFLQVFTEVIQPSPDSAALPPAAGGGRGRSRVPRLKSG